MRWKSPAEHATQCPAFLTQPSSAMPILPPFTACLVDSQHIKSSRTPACIHTHFQTPDARNRKEPGVKSRRASVYISAGTAERASGGSLVTTSAPGPLFSDSVSHHLLISSCPFHLLVYCTRSQMFTAHSHTHKHRLGKAKRCSIKGTKRGAFSGLTHPQVS